jgi:hypothetical protein
MYETEMFFLHFSFPLFYVASHPFLNLFLFLFPSFYLPFIKLILRFVLFSHFRFTSLQYIFPSLFTHLFLFITFFLLLFLLPYFLNFCLFCSVPLFLQFSHSLTLSLHLSFFFSLLSVSISLWFFPSSLVPVPPSRRAQHRT